MSHRSEVVEDGEPLLTETRDVQGGKGELKQNIPSEACRILGIEKGTQIKIEIYGDGFFVTTENVGE